MVLNGVFVASVGLNNNTELEHRSLKAQDRIWIGSRLTDTAENDWIGADTILCIGSMHP